MNILAFVVGVVIGILISLIAAKVFMPDMMISVHKSRFGLEETVGRIEAAAMVQGWKVPKIYDLQNSLVEAGYADMTKLHVISLCQPDHAYKILKDDRRKQVTALMPCRIAVYEDNSGNVMIAGMDVGLMSKLFGGVIEEVMGKVAKEEQRFLAPLIAD